MGDDGMMQKTFVVTKWGTIERQPARKLSKPSSKEKKATSNKGEVKLIYSKSNAKFLMEQQYKMIDRAALIHRKSSVHESFNSISLLDYIDPAERVSQSNPDYSKDSFDIRNHLAKRYSPPMGKIF